MAEPKPNMANFEWAAKRAGLSRENLVKKFPRYEKWLTGDAEPTLKQVFAFAKAAHVAVADLYSTSTPEYPLTISDFRTLPGRKPINPSPELYDTLMVAMQRQAWLKDYFETIGDEPISLVGSASLDDNPDEVAQTLRKTLLGGAPLPKRADDAFKVVRESVEASRVAVFVNSVVGNNTRRLLDVDEFRGFTLSDPVAPVIFINGGDAPSARLFTLVHETGHLLLGETGVGNDGALFGAEAQRSEAFCNGVAASFLMPRGEVLETARHLAIPDASHLADVVSEAFPVSRQAAILRCRHLGLVSEGDLRAFLDDDCARMPARRRASGGPRFNLLARTRLGSTFPQAVDSALESGRIGLGEACDLTGLKPATYERTFGEAA